MNPAYAAGFAALGIDSAAAFLELPGEVVSGHPDRHVVRVEVPQFEHAFYLKRQHLVRRRERWRNWRAGFGWVSRCERERSVLKQLEDNGLPCPQWVAVGEDGRGRSFLIVAELTGAVDMRRVLANNELSQRDRTLLADRLGGLIAQIHGAGFTTPDLSAKHILLTPDLQSIALIDWQAARRVRSVPEADRVRGLAVLHASIKDSLVTRRERFRVLRRAIGRAPQPEFAERVCAEAERLANRRSIREQRVISADSQRLVWLDGEAVCAIPEVAAEWPKPAVAAAFYGQKPGTLSICLPGGRSGQLICGRSNEPFGRARAWIRGRVWRSPGTKLGRLLFHLERHGVRAPRLLAFGQRLTGAATAEWFVLHTPPSRSLGSAEELGRALRMLHEAGCLLSGDPLAALGADEGGPCIRDATAIRLVKNVTARGRNSDLKLLLSRLERKVRARTEASYWNTIDPVRTTTTRPIPIGAAG